MRVNYEVRYKMDFYRTDDGIGAWYSSPLPQASSPVAKRCG